MNVTIKKITGHLRVLFAALVTAISADGRAWAWEESYYYNPDMQEPRLTAGQEIRKPSHAYRLENLDRKIN